MTPDIHIVGRCRFTDGSVREVFEDAEGPQYILDDECDLVAGQWLPPADEPNVAASKKCFKVVSTPP
jgi:hypothetical protein